MNSNILLTEEEMTRLRSCNSERDWNRTCDAVKAARGGLYPADWWQRIMLSGEADRIFKRWNGSTEIKIEKLDVERF